MAGLKIVIEDDGHGTFQIFATQYGNTIINNHSYFYAENIIDNMDIVTAWLKSDLRQLKSPVLLNPKLDMVFCLECKTTMWGEVLFREDEFYKVYNYNYVTPFIISSSNSSLSTSTFEQIASPEIV